MVSKKLLASPKLRNSMHLAGYSVTVTKYAQYIHTFVLFTQVTKHKHHPALPYNVFLSPHYKFQLRRKLHGKAVQTWGRSHRNHTWRRDRVKAKRLLSDWAARVEKERRQRRSIANLRATKQHTAMQWQWTRKILFSVTHRLNVLAVPRSKTGAVLTSLLHPKPWPRTHEGQFLCFSIPFHHRTDCMPSLQFNMHICRITDYWQELPDDWRWTVITSSKHIC